MPRKKNGENDIKVLFDAVAMFGNATDMERLRERLLEIALESGEDDVALAAIREYYDRALGKPRQAVAITGPGGGPLQVANLHVDAQDVADILREEFGDTGALDESGARMLTDAGNDGEPH